MADKDALDRALAIARRYIAARRERPVWPTATLGDIRAALGGPLPPHPLDASEVVADLTAMSRRYRDNGKQELERESEAPAVPQSRDRSKEPSRG